MMRAISWVVAAALFAVIAHIVYVIFAPEQEMSRLIAESARIGGMNHFAVLDRPEQETLLKENGQAAVTAVCPFDLSGGRLVLDTTMPDALWSLTVYSDNGRNAYAINDAQAGTNRFKLTIKKSPGLIGMILGEGADQGVPDEGWTAETPSSRGLAVLWVALEDNGFRPFYADVLNHSTCTVEQGS